MTMGAIDSLTASTRCLPVTNWVTAKQIQFFLAALVSSTLPDIHLVEPRGSLNSSLESSLESEES